MMKKFFYLIMVAFVATLPFLLTSCGDDDEANEIDGSGIVGTWQITSQSASFGDVEDGVYLLQFKEGGKYVEVDDELNGHVEIEYGTWAFSDNVSTINYGNKMTTKLQVTSMSKNKINANVVGLYTMELTKVSDSKIAAYLEEE